MERAVFLVEDDTLATSSGGGASSGERIECMLNPQQLVLRRTAGVGRVKSIGGWASSEHSDDPLLFLGGGSTELLLELLFDVTLSGLTEPPSDVRLITERLWQLAERGSNGPNAVPRVRFIWGRSWNFLGVITAVSERVEHFDDSGAPRRSWIRLRLVRVTNAVPAPASRFPAALETSEAAEPATLDGDWVELHEMVGTGDSLGNESDTEEPAPSSWLMQLAHRTLGDPALWRVLAEQNDIADPLRIPAGTVLRVRVQKARSE